MFPVPVVYYHRLQTIHLQTPRAFGSQTKRLPEKWLNGFAENDSKCDLFANAHNKFSGL